MKENILSSPGIIILSLTLTTEAIAQQIKWINIGERFCSDHSPVCMLWVIVEHRRLGILWRLDNFILEANGVVQLLKQK